MARQWLAQSVCRQTILSEAEVEEANDGYGGRSELFLLFDKIGATNKAYSAFMTKGGQELEHLRSNTLAGRGEGVVDVEQAYCALEGTVVQGRINAGCFGGHDNGEERVNIWRDLFPRQPLDL